MQKEERGEKGEQDDLSITNTTICLGDHGSHSDLLKLVFQ